ncbi:hypothetical protein HPB51_029235 [Rhipicephalus microplus]|uniref:Uncharacterized protein n=1 Tax=Rhipicephalus microplus TaxID=6941 RepID=A0A9J6CUX8_RHIMP|nr:hypothetical protein HPB51_029235 [Rhipicephalus microplus]
MATQERFLSFVTSRETSRPSRSPVTWAAAAGGVHCTTPRDSRVEAPRAEGQRWRIVNVAVVSVSTRRAPSAEAPSRKRRAPSRDLEASHHRNANRVARGESGGEAAAAKLIFDESDFKEFNVKEPVWIPKRICVFPASLARITRNFVAAAPGWLPCLVPAIPVLTSAKNPLFTLLQAVTVHQVRDEASLYQSPHLDKGPRVVRKLRFCGHPSISVAPASAYYRGDFACAFTTRPEPPRSSWTISSTRAHPRLTSLRVDNIRATANKLLGNIFSSVFSKRTYGRCSEVPDADDPKKTLSLLRRLKRTSLPLQGPSSD